MSFDEQDEQDRQSEPGLPPGSVIAGRFRVERKLGEGGMGAVYAAINASTNRMVALKVLHPEYALKKEVVRRFLREAKAATAIRHPNVIEILDVVEIDHDEPVMVMELLEGEALDALLERRGALPLGEVARIMTPVVSAVGAAHALGIIHRDLKPENIFLARSSGGTMVPKVLDFGIAKVLDPNQINELATKSGATRTGSMLGTPHYMSIEQACGEKDLDHRTDVWSLGIILYSMLSGRRPYEGENYGQILKSLMTSTPDPIDSLVPGLPSDVADLVTRSMARSRQDRPTDLREVYAVLARYTDDRTVQAPPSVAGSLLERDLASSATLSAASMYTSQNALPTRSGGGSRGLKLAVGGGVVAVLAVGAIALALATRGPAEVAAGPEPTASAIAAPTQPVASTALAGSDAPVEIVGSADVPPPAVSSHPVPATTIKPVATATAPKTAPTKTAAPPATGTSTAKGGIIETLPY